MKITLKYHCTNVVRKVNILKINEIFVIFNMCMELEQNLYSR
jgi:hypothetical protein